ncbi:MAG: hypothetical protein JJU02_07670 [Cryomorphaceae bacterium]|nr:hypothetical protein [Cryomorphaceae bacterium]
MRFLYFGFFLFPILVCGQSRIDSLSHADDLVQSKQYETAFSWLESMDPKNAQPEIILRKTHLALHCHVATALHQMFAFVDIDPNDDIENYRGVSGSFTFFQFPIKQLLNKLHLQQPYDLELTQALVELYYQASTHYGAFWQGEDVYDNLQKHLKAYHKLRGGGNAESYYRIGVSHLAKKDYASAEENFRVSLMMDSSSENAAAYFNLAFTYMEMGNIENTIHFAKKAFYKFTERAYKADAARILGDMFTQKKDKNQAQTYYEASLNLDPGNYFTLLPLLKIYVGKQHPESQRLCLVFFELDPTNPTIYDELVSIFEKYHQKEELVQFFQNQISNYEDHQILGNLHFHIGKLQMDADKIAARHHFLEARNQFEQIYENGHGVFAVVDAALKLL